MHKCELNGRKLALLLYMSGNEPRIRITLGHLYFQIGAWLRLQSTVFSVRRLSLTDEM